MANVVNFGTSSGSSTTKGVAQDKNYKASFGDDKNVLILLPINLENLTIGNNTSVKFEQ